MLNRVLKPAQGDQVLLAWGKTQLLGRDLGIQLRLTLQFDLQFRRKVFGLIFLGFLCDRYMFRRWYFQIVIVFYCSFSLLVGLKKLQPTHLQVLFKANFLDLWLLVDGYEILAIKRILNGVYILSLQYIAFLPVYLEATMVIILIQKQGLFGLLWSCSTFLHVSTVGIVGGIFALCIVARLLLRVIFLGDVVWISSEEGVAVVYVDCTHFLQKLNYRIIEYGQNCNTARVFERSPVVMILRDSDCFD